MKKSISAQVSVFETGFILLLLFSSFIYFSLPQDSEENSYTFRGNSFIDVLSKNSSFRNNVLLENISNSSQTQNWSSINSLISKEFGSYSLLVKTNDSQKEIFSCTETLNKEVFERVITINSLNSYQFRTVVFGVCY